MSSSFFPLVFVVCGSFNDFFNELFFIVLSSRLVWFFYPGFFFRTYSRFVSLPLLLKNQHTSMKNLPNCEKNNWNIVWFIVYTFYFAPLKPTTDSHSIQFNWIYICISISVLSLLYSIYMCVSLCVLFNPVSFVLSQTFHPYPLFPMIYTLPLLWFLVSNKNRQFFFCVILYLNLYILYHIWFFCLISVKKMIPQTWINWKLQI